jgi:twitching motility protein PilT
MPRIDELLTLLKTEKGSDLHLASGLEPRMRVKGELATIPGWEVLDDAGLRELLRPIASEAHWQDYERENDLDFAYAIPGVARFRANFFVQENGAGAVFRIIPEEILTVEDLGLPDAIRSLADARSGLVLVTGPTGSGKSTTLAAVIDSINKKKARHIVTIEDPVEFVHRNQMSVVSHREVGAHTGSFSAALRAAIRQDADVVLVGEMRDKETIELALTAAEMGLLVFGTLHTNGAAKTVDRIVDAFPADDQDMVRLSLSESITGIVSQLLIPTADGKGRCAVHEILLRTSGLANVIREGNTPMLASIIQSGKNVGMQNMDDALFALAKQGRISGDDAYRSAREKQRFEPMLGKNPAAAA